MPACRLGEIAGSVRRGLVQADASKRRDASGTMIEMPSIVGDVVRSVGLSTAMRAAGVVTGLLPIPQPMLLVGPGASGRLGQALCGFGHRKILIVTDRVVAEMGLPDALTAALTGGRHRARRVRRDHAGRADPADREGHRVLREARLRRDRRVRRRLADGRGEDDRAARSPTGSIRASWSATSRACTRRRRSTRCRPPRAPAPR